MMARWQASCPAGLLLLLLLVPRAAAVRHLQQVVLEANNTNPGGSRVNDAGTKVIHGVPVYNYARAFSPGRATSFLERVKKDSTPGVEHWLVFLRPGIEDPRIVQLCKSSEKKCAAHGHSRGVAFLEFQGKEEELAGLLATVKSEVAFVEPDLPIGLFPGVPVEKARMGIQSTTPWGLDRVHAGQRAATGRGVHVYVLDTGVRTTHVDFGGRAIPTLELSGSGTITECNGDANCAMDGNGHGTHTAGTVAGRRVGVAPDATIHAVKVLGDDGHGANSWILLALDWVATQAQRPAVASLSLGAEGNEYAQQVAVDRVVQAGVTVVVAAGNFNQDACRYQPAFVPSAITVGATDPSDERADYSNWGSCVGIFAPGTDINSLGHWGDDATAVMSGTSMACPHVSGAVALLLERNPNWSPQQVAERLWQKAEKGVVRGALLGAPNVFLSVLGDAGDEGGEPKPTPQPSPPSFGPPSFGSPWSPSPPPFGSPWSPSPPPFGSPWAPSPPPDQAPSPPMFGSPWAPSPPAFGGLPWAPSPPAFGSPWAPAPPAFGGSPWAPSPPAFGGGSPWAPAPPPGWGEPMDLEPVPSPQPDDGGGAPMDIDEPDPAPTPAPPKFDPLPVTSVKCPEWSAHPHPDAAGNCHCPFGSKCLFKHDGQMVHCPQAQSFHGMSPTSFVPTCPSCGCYE